MRHRRASLSVAMAALLASVAPALVAVPASAQTAGDIDVDRTVVNPGGTVTVTNAAGQECDTEGKEHPFASVYGTGPTEQHNPPHDDDIDTHTPKGSWRVRFTFSADTAPGAYTLTAKCIDSGSVDGYRRYSPITIQVQALRPGPPVMNPLQGPPGIVVRVSAGSAVCPPPSSGAASQATVALLDANRAVRGVARTDIAGDGGWSTSLQVPSLDPQNAVITASCRVTGAAADYAIYTDRTFVVQAVPVTVPPNTAAPATTTTTTAAPPVTSPGGSTVAPPPPTAAPTTTVAPTPTTVPAPGFPPSPIAVAIDGDPTYLA